MYSSTHLPQKNLGHFGLAFNPDSSTLEQTQEIIFIDSNVSDIDELIAGTKPNAAVYILHPQEDGIAQITSILKSHSHIKAIHIVSHGLPGCVFLGNSVLSLETLESYRSQLQTWSVPYLLLYGCDVGKNQVFLQQLSQLTQSIIAASDDVTGNPKLGGDWDLEITTGNINISLAFQPEVTANYPSILGAELVKDMTSGSASTSYYDFTSANNTFYFEAHLYNSTLGTYARQLWTSNGTAAGTTVLKNFLGDDPYDYIPVGDSVYFKVNTYNSTAGNQYQLWKSNGTPAGTTLVKTFGNNSYWGNFTVANNLLYFTVDDGINGKELWKTDGTTTGTSLVKDIRTGVYGSDPYNLTNVNGILYFSANNEINGNELWKTDGSTEGTTLVKNINIYGSSSPDNLTNVNGTLYFNAYDEINGYELWKTDGTTDGTVLVADFDDHPSDEIYPSYYDFTSANNTFYFEARIDDYTLGTSENQLWTSNGTAEGTTLVKNFLGDDPYNYIPVGDSVYFQVDTYNSTTGYQYQLWKSDATTAGTTLLKSFQNNFGGYYSNPDNWAVANNLLYFTVDDGIHGNELWKTDGTTAGTTLVKDIYPGIYGSEPSNLTNVNGTLYFMAYDEINGYELWKTNGTTAGTTLVQDIYIGDYSSYPSNLTNVNGTLYFTANDGIQGEELWRSTDIEDTSGSDILTGTPGNDNLYGYAGEDVINALAGNDLLDGGTGADQLQGSTGNDTYVVDNVGDIVTELASEGTDLIQSSVTYSLPANVENLTLTGTTAINGTGNTLANILTGNTANNILNGGLGNDTYVVANAGDVVTELAGEGTDLIQSSITYTLPGEVENLTLTGTTAINGTGNTVANIITGNTANNILNGSTGADQLKGSTGNDTYVVDNVGDIVTELASQGTDLIQSSVTYTLPVNVENLTLTGTTTLNGTGNTLANIITGNTANNILNGSSGADQLKGSTGNDTYVIDNTGDIVTELASEGTDLVQSSVAYTLPANVENLTLTGTTALNVTGNTLANVITGNIANSILNGGAGNDTYVVANAGNIITELANGGSDLIQSSVTYTLPGEVENLTLTGTTAINGTGNTVANIITGNTANNILNGGTGADQLKGGTGNDTYVVDNAGDIVTELASGGTDLVQSSVTYTLPVEVENLTLTGTTAINGTGNTLGNIITGNTANNIINGSSGADQLKGNAGNDTYVVDNVGDIVTELASQGTDLIQSSVTYTLPGEVENLTLTGTTAINGTGNTLANIITGNTGNNILNGGTGNDTYVVDNVGDVVTELASGGTDLIQSSVTYTLPGEVENLTLTGTTAINGTGNTLANIITGNTANNIINGSSGADQLKGGTGNDTYVVDNTGDVVTELASGGTDLIQSSVTYTLPGEVENLTLTGTTAINGTGNTLANIITGNTGNNIINGSSGADQLKGGTGNDTYVVDNAGDIVTELASGGTDLIQSSVTYTLPVEVENLTLTGTTAINGTGNALANIITGNTANNILTGGAGNDTYVVANAGDIVTELASGGTDLVQSSVTYTLPVEVENLTLTGTTAINGTGNALANIITGNTANNILDGSSGADQLKGSTGNDTYVVDNAGDVVTELASGGTDLIQSSVTYALPGEVENLTLTGITAINGTGNILANIITGNTANNILNGSTGNDNLIGSSGADQLLGGDGNDSLSGDAANDTLTGGLGADKFIYNTNAAFTTTAVGVDSITDFTIAQGDLIVLDKTTFTSISSIAGTGFSVATEFAKVTTDALAATSAADIVYNTATGGLFYNQNGTAAGFGTGAHFLTLTTKPVLTATQFVIQA